MDRPPSASPSSSFLSTSLPTPRLEHWSSPPFINRQPNEPDKLNKDINEVVYQCNIICDNMVQGKGQFLHLQSQQDMESTRLWLDDMVNRANEVLNALLRLRKYQMAAEQTRASNSEALFNQQESTSSSRQRKRVQKRPAFQGRCHSCNISETPEWRRGPDGARTLCNACGLHYAKLTKKQQQQQQTQLLQIMKAQQQEQEQEQQEQEQQQSPQQYQYPYQQQEEQMVLSHSISSADELSRKMTPPRDDDDISLDRLSTG
ncbi:hypothetical protein BCV71DRAFT_226745 [Rhizopus microsporus]|uniref:GATA-type domain-containing protein n=1 Tax=Rhizopus microsporus TaxID=58291 RepID=A0A1X0S3C2_RHIZD|nr:hypothetical protein BCV71DRAFT_226745 [Rhizopus microsporus]